ncbi:MAG: FixH family protein [Bacteriovoracaceae bacterium]|nr:FixH family protein [Bacteriovoracaceae bacterium]
MHHCQKKIKIFLSFLCILGLAHCAKPNYVDENLNFLSENKLSSCSFYFKVENICFDVEWGVRPGEAEVGDFEIVFYAPETLAPTELSHDLSVKLRMPSMSHPSPHVKIQKLSEGRYHVERVFFNMPGDWEIQIRLVTPNSEASIEEVIIPYHI